MKISPLPPTGIPQAAPQEPDPPVARSHSIRSIQMRVNQTPGRLDPGETPAGATPVAGDGAALSIPPTTETSAEKAVEETQPLSPQLAAIARERRALQQERQAFEREKAASAQSSTQADVVPIDRLKSEPLSVLLEHGVTYDQLTEAILASQNGYSPELQALKAELKALKDGVDKTFSEKETQQRQQVLAEMRREATQLAEGEAFELVKATGSVPKVIKLIERTYDERGEVLDVQEAMSLVEAELEEEAMRMAKLGKVQAKLAPPPAPTPQPQQRQMRTLTNRDTASVPLSAKARAIAAFNGSLRR